MNEMVLHTSSAEAPWKIISGEDKKNAQLTILKDFTSRRSAYLKNGSTPWFFCDIVIKFL